MVNGLHAIVDTHRGIADSHHVIVKSHHAVAFSFPVQPHLVAVLDRAEGSSMKRSSTIIDKAA